MRSFSGSFELGMRIWTTSARYYLITWLRSTHRYEIFFNITIEYIFYNIIYSIILLMRCYYYYYYLFHDIYWPKTIILANIIYYIIFLLEPKKKKKPAIYCLSISNPMRTIQCYYNIDINSTLGLLDRRPRALLIIVGGAKSE